MGFVRPERLDLNEIRCSIVIPAKNEGGAISSTLTRIKDCVAVPFECIVVIDNPDDSTIKTVNEFKKMNSEFRVEINSKGHGPASAIKYGIGKAKSNVCVITMADGSDDPRLVTDLVQLIDRGVSIAAASRYMPGGQQIGAPFIKSFLSKAAGKSLYFLRRVGTRDATNSFKAYSKEFIDDVGIESEHGFEMAIELVAKAKVYGYPVAELPTIWLERESGKSSFKLLKWLPKYLRWYLYAFKRPKKRAFNA
jgi:glycosyltransferase involved in cell wall biosynthesis